MTALTLYPAIDLKDGAVRAAAARRDGRGDGLFRRSRRAGARLAGRRLRLAACRGPERRLRRPAGERRRGRARSCAAVTIPVQLGGGIRDLAGIEAWLAAGVRRVILGSAAVKNPAWCARPAAPFRAGSPSASTRATASSRPKAGPRPPTIAALDLALRFEDAGVAAIIYTDIGRDGMLTGLNMEQTVDLARRLHDAGDRQRRRRRRSRTCGAAARRPPGARIEGVIVGRALYDGRVDPAAALALLARLSRIRIRTRPDISVMHRGSVSTTCTCSLAMPARR